jgi:hypothetical protein
MCHKDRPSVRDNGLWDIMIVDNVWHVEFGILSNPVCGGYRYSVSWLSQTIHNDPYRVVPTRGEGQTHNEVHEDVFPFPLENAQGLQISGWSQMNGLDSSTRVTFWHILCNFSLHSCPLETLLKALIHLVGSWMDWIPRAMSLIHDLKAKLKILWNHKAVLEP